MLSIYSFIEVRRDKNIMAKDPNIYLKLEVSRDRNSGNLNIIVHFDLNAHNVSNDEKGYFWIPTEEEKDLISDSFELMPSAKTKPSLEKMEIQSTPRPETKQEPGIQQKTEFTKPSQPAPTPEIKQKPEPEPKKQTTPPLSQEPKPQFEPEKKKSTLPPLEKPQDETVFGITEPAIPNEAEKREENKEETKVDEEMIVKANPDAIEKALKKYTAEKDESMIEADEKTIIEKVLKQKKKWKK